MRRINICPVDELPVGQFLLREIEGREIGLIRLPDGEIRAVLNRCPHRGAPVCRGIVSGTWPPCEHDRLTYDQEGRVLTCPWHGWQFDLQSGVELYRDRPARLRLYDTSIECGVVGVLI